MRFLILTHEQGDRADGMGAKLLPLVRALEALGHDVRSVDGQRGFVSLWRTSLPRAREADVVLASTHVSAWLVSYLLYLLHGKRYIVFVNEPNARKTRRNPFLRPILKSALFVVATSRAAQERLEQLGLADAHVALIPPGGPVLAADCDPKAASEYARGKYALGAGPVILSAGPFSKDGAQMALIEAMPWVSGEFPEARLVLVGDGPLLGPAVTAAAKLGARKQLLFPGNVPEDDLAALYESCDIFVAGPEGDAVAAEAWARGKPVIAARDSAAADLIENGQSSLLIDSMTPEALSKAMLQLLRDPAQARAIGENARERIVRELNWTESAKKLLAKIGPIP